VSETHDEIRALRVMVDELRAEPPPELPWDAIEQRLLSRLSLADSRAPAPTRARRGLGQASPFSRVIGFAAAAAALVLAGGLGSHPAEPRAAAPEHRIEASTFAVLPGSSAHDLARLAPGDVIEAGAEPLTFAQEGLVSWTLAPGGALRVRSVGLGHTVALERGEIRAEVTPRSPSEGLVESFAVEVEGTRVAVHGTAFSVKRERDHVLVDVAHGTVAVGPVGHVGVTTGHLLVGPARASFSLDGGRSARLLDPTPERVAVAAALPDREPAPAAPTAGDTPPAADHPAPHPAEGALAVAPVPRHGPAARASTPPNEPAPHAEPAPPPEPPRLTVDIVRARLERCFRQQSEAGRDATLHIDPISTTLSIDLAPDGSARTARFTTRLKPEIVTCAGSAIAGRFPDGLGHVDIPVTFQP
jgi:hypothetical protein